MTSPITPLRGAFISFKPNDRFWFLVNELLCSHEQKVAVGAEVKYKYDDPEIKRRHFRTRPRHSHINTPSPDALAFFLNQCEPGAQSLTEQARASAPEQAVAILDRCSKNFRMTMDSVLDGENQVARIEDLKGYTVAVEATWYLQRMLEVHSEPLLSALGGLPYGLSCEIEADLDNWKAHGVAPMFVFDGLYIIGQEDMALRIAKEASRRSDKAWESYQNAKTDQQLKDAVKGFGELGAIQPKMFYRFFQEILYERGLYYEIASHSACAHMAHFDKHPKTGKLAFEVMMGSPELLLYDIDFSIISKMDFNSGCFYVLVKPSLPQKLNVSEDTLTNALLMTGTSFLPAFPVLKETDIIKQQPFTINDAINIYRTANKSMITLCDTWTEILQKQEPNWQDKYRKAIMALKHNIHFEQHTGVANVVVSNIDQLTGDHPEYIALCLPQEMYHYLIHGDIGRRVMNWLSYLEMLVFPPLAGGDAPEYRRLITDQLVPIQSQAIVLNTSRLHRGFQHRDITIRFWFDNSTTVVIKPLAVEPAPEGLAATWRVKQAFFENQKAAATTKPGSFSFAVLSLQDKDFSATTRKAVSEIQILKSPSEILSNAMWRLLHLRGYINNEHQLTKWGTAFNATLIRLNSMGFDAIGEIEEAAFLAFELVRFDQLNARNRHREWIGVPQKGSDQDKAHCLLIARCACLVRLRHKETGYTGPLSKNLLAYNSIISAVRVADRDLVEAIILSMFMFAHADRRNARDDNSPKVRKRNSLDWQKLGLSLPLGKDVDIGLGIAVKTYLDDVAQPGSSSDEKSLAKVNYVKEKLPHSVDFSGDLEKTFNFFDALYAGVCTLGSEIPEADLEVWKGAHRYLADRR